VQLIIAFIVAIILRTQTDFAFWQIALVFVAIVIGLSMLGEVVKKGRHQESTSSPIRKTSRQGQLEHIQNRLSVKEPIRASLIDVVKEAHALRTMVTRAGSHNFAFQNFGATLTPEEFQAKSDQAIDIALDLSDRFGIIAKSAKGRARSQRTHDAIASQQLKMERLKEALEYSRSTIEVLILTKGEGDNNSEKLSRGLSNLSDALEESYADGFEQLEEGTEFPSSPKLPELTPQAETS
jgi:hypothetical protein